MAGVFAGADLYSLTLSASSGLEFGGRRVRTTFVDRLGPLQGRRMLQLPFMPLAWRYATRSRYDVVVTSSHACAKGFWPARQALHLCYCYTPMRYVWLSSIDKRRRQSTIAGIAARAFQSWDIASVGWVDEFAAISTAVQLRIQDLYGRPSQVISPPVDTGFYTPGKGERRGGYALAVSRMVPYKRLDLAIRACHRVGHPLVMAGSGPAEADLRALAADLGADVSFVIRPDDIDLRSLYRGADALVFPAEEDFGIVPVEAQACGTPVVAFGRGGAVDTVLPGVTGILVSEQDESAFALGIAGALDGGFSSADCRQNAERFSRSRFEDAFANWVIESAAARGIAVPDPRTQETV